MKKTLFAAIIVSTTLLSSCFGTAGLAGVGSSTSTGSQNSSSALSSILGSVVGGSNGSNILGSVLGSFINTTNSNTLVGTWTYKEPTIQFESSNLLAQAGGAVASQTIVNKISPYYEKIGIKPGVARLTLNQDKTCQISLSTKTISGTYTYDQSTGTITVNGTTGIKLFTAYVSVSMSQLALTLDTTNLLSMMQGVASKTSNSTLSTISGLSSSFNGMKTGFLFVK